MQVQVILFANLSRSVILATIIDSYHKINEGHVGVYFKYGALLDELTVPGVHFKAPFVTDCKELQTRPVTDTLNAFDAITKDGIQNKFKGIQIITRVKIDKLIGVVRKFGLDFKQALVFDRVKEELRIFSANHTVDEVYNTMFLEIVHEVQKNVEEKIRRLSDDAVEILNLVIPKPNIPPDIAHNYKQVCSLFCQSMIDLVNTTR